MDVVEEDQEFSHLVSAFFQYEKVKVFKALESMLNFPDGYVQIWVVVGSLDKFGGALIHPQDLHDVLEDVFRESGRWYKVWNVVRDHAAQPS